MDSNFTIQELEDFNPTEDFAKTVASNIIYVVGAALGGMLAGFISWQFYILSYNIAEKIRKSYVKKFRPPTPVQNLRNHLQAYYVLSIYILAEKDVKPNLPLKPIFKNRPHVEFAFPVIQSLPY